jgi:acylaminoacyl-peptidase
MSESEQYYQALRLRQVDTLLVRVPGAPHALDLRPSQVMARVGYVLAWFGKHGSEP